MKILFNTFSFYGKTIMKPIYEVVNVTTTKTIYLTNQLSQELITSECRINRIQI